MFGPKKSPSLVEVLLQNVVSAIICSRASRYIWYCVTFGTLRQKWWAIISPPRGMLDCVRPTLDINLVLKPKLNENVRIIMPYSFYDSENFKI